MGFETERCLLFLFSCGWCDFSKYGLALALLVTWVLADDHDATVATDDLALVANLLDAWVYLHVSYFCLGLLLTGFKTPVRLNQTPSLLFVAINDSATSQVVGAELYDHAVLRKDADVVLTHLARDVCQNLVSIGQLDTKHSVR